MILSRVVAFQAIECVIRRLDSGDANLLLITAMSFAAFPSGSTFPWALAAC
jgi:hypothetical protein